MKTRQILDHEIDNDVYTIGFAVGRQTSRQDKKKPFVEVIAEWQNPYPEGSTQAHDWQMGWDAGWESET